MASVCSAGPAKNKAKTITVGQNLVRPSGFMKAPPTVKKSATRMTFPQTSRTSILGKHVFRSEHVAGARRDGLAYERDEVDVLRTECGTNYFDSELGIEILAEKNVDIGVARDRKSVV